MARLKLWDRISPDFAFHNSHRLLLSIPKYFRQPALHLYKRLDTLLRFPCLPKYQTKNHLCRMSLFVSYHELRILYRTSNSISVSISNAVWREYLRLIRHHNRPLPAPTSLNRCRWQSVRSDPVQVSTRSLFGDSEKLLLRCTGAGCSRSPSSLFLCWACWRKMERWLYSRCSHADTDRVGVRMGQNVCNDNVRCHQIHRKHNSTRWNLNYRPCRISYHLIRYNH